MSIARKVKTLESIHNLIRTVNDKLALRLNRCKCFTQEDGDWLEPAVSKVEHRAHADRHLVQLGSDSETANFLGTATLQEKSTLSSTDVTITTVMVDHINNHRLTIADVGKECELLLLNAAGMKLEKRLGSDPLTLNNNITKILVAVNNHDIRRVKLEPM